MSSRTIVLPAVPALLAALVTSATASNLPVHILQGAPDVTLTSCDVNRDRVYVDSANVIHKTSPYSLDERYAPFAPGTEWAGHVGFTYRVSRAVKAVKVHFEAVDAFGQVSDTAFDLTLTGLIEAGDSGGNATPDQEAYDFSPFWRSNEDIQCSIREVAYADGTVWTRH